MPRPTGREWLSIVAIGVLWFGIYNVALNEGEHHVDAGTASMLLQVSPILIAVLATIFLSERFTTYLAVGLALAFAGVALIGTADSGSGDRDILGVVLCLVAATVYSISVILQKPLVARCPALHIIWLACTVGAVACLPFAGQLVDDTRDAPTSSILWVVYLGVFPTAIAFTTYAYALRHMSASSLGVTTYLVPPITIVMGLVFLSRDPAHHRLRRWRARAARCGGRPPQAQAQSLRAGHEGDRARAWLVPCCARERRRGRTGRPRGR